MVTRVRRARRIATEEEKYHKAVRVAEEISSLHCIETLSSHHADYKRTKDPSLRSNVSLYKKYMRNTRVVSAFESSEQFILMEQRQQELIIRPRCDNC